MCDAEEWYERAFYKKLIKAKMAAKRFLRELNGESVNKGMF